MNKKIMIGLLIAGLVLGGAATVVYAQPESSPICPPENNITEVLGLTVIEIRNAYRDGKTLEDLFDAQGLDYGAYLAELTENSLACVVDALANGDITEDKATRLKDAIQNRSDKGIPFSLRMRIFNGERTNKLQSGSLENLAKVMGMETSDLTNAFKEGYTLGQIAEQQGLDLIEVFDDWIETQIGDINQEVEDGKFDTDRGEILVERLDEKFGAGFDFENWNPPAKPLGQRARLTLLTGKDLVNTVLDAMNMTVEDLRSALQDGQTIDELVADKGVDLDAIYLTWLEEQIDTVNEKLASEAITQERADTLLEKLNNQLGESFPLDYLKNLKRGLENFRENRSNGWNRPGRMPGCGDFSSSQQAPLVDDAGLNF